MARIEFDDYFCYIPDVLNLSAFLAYCSFLIGWIVYGITWRILRALGKPSPGHLYWRIMLVLGILIAAFIVIAFSYCLSLLIKELVRRAVAYHRCRTRGHDWDERLHCRRCEEVMPHAHEWDGCRCTFCGERRDAEHDWNGCTCRVCGSVRSEEHEWKIEACYNCDGTGHVTRYGDWGDEYEEPCGCVHPLERVCVLCGRREDIAE